MTQSALAGPARQDSVARRPISFATVWLLSASVQRVADLLGRVRAFIICLPIADVGGTIEHAFRRVNDA